ncbi:hypothetical protein FRP1_30255 (plasmid) [Pseudonocardia sp. EC080625-04]|nr:hypothetical protein FRP1_30255 [Pseudonocardia sp. EC080625-04]
MRASVVIDYQNIHLTAHDLFAAPGAQRHTSLIHPLHFATQLVAARNAGLKEGFAPAVLSRVRVFRGLPSEEHDPNQYRRNLAQRAEWTRDQRVDVHLRPLTYRYERDATGRHLLDVHGRRQIVEVREKGVDVLVALAFVREAADPDVDLVILASHDTDLAPALDEALRIDRAKVETCSWWNPDRYRTGAPRPSGERRVWNTRVRQTEFDRAQDRGDYS